MGIRPDQFRIIWQAIVWWMDEKGVTPTYLHFQTGYSEERIRRGLNGEPVPIESDFLHSCVGVFGLRSARTRTYEDTEDVMTDEECIEVLTVPLRTTSRQGHLWD